MKTTEHIWHEYNIKLARFIRSKVAEEWTDDLLQDVFMKIHTRIDSLKEETKLESWLYQITRNTIIDHYRSKRATEELPEWLEQPQPKEEEAARKELLLCLVPMINELPEKYRCAVSLYEIENKTQKEIAEQEGISLSGAKSRVQRGRVLLTAIMLDCCQFETGIDNHVISYQKKESDCKFC
ncbi:MAG: RNA polymerase sigma factor SigZ [Thiotrichaceae bacterium]